MPSASQTLTRFRNRREAEKTLAEIVEDGGCLSEYRIDEREDGSCVILILETNGDDVAGMLGA